MEHAGFQHEALIYEGGDDYLAGTIPFLRQGLEAGEPTLVAVGPAQTELLEGELRGDSALIRFLPMQEVGRNPGTIIPLWREFVDENRGRPVRGIGEPVWAARSPQALEECHRHEGLLNVAFTGGGAFSLLCPYDAETLPGDVIERVGASHRHLRREGGVGVSRAFDSTVDYFGGELPPPAEAPEVLPFGLEQLGEVRRRVASAGKRAGLHPRGVADLVTATSELAANSVMHGGGSGILRLWWEDGRLLAEVEDRGRIEEPLVGRLRPDIEQEGGRGLWLANQLCDLVQIRSDQRGTVVRLHLLVAEQEPAFV
ncbi:MAG TPA: sensor histidine kinase [Solirubrobacterales bacterium]|nr:sensor histidine kinase [Solirubrobacterales bacterium]